MRNLLLKLSGVAIVFTLLLTTTGCEDDEPIITNPVGPQIDILSGTDLTSMDTELAPGESFTVAVAISTGDEPLNSFSFLVDGQTVSAAQIDNYITEYLVDGVAQTTVNNPYLLVGDDVKDGATITLEIVPFEQMDGETRTYSFLVTDEGNETAQESLEITIIDPTTPIDTTMMGIFFNVAGGENGSIDLDSGENVPSQAGGGTTQAEVESSELRDMGLDCTIPAPGFNWRRQVSTVNGADMVAVDESQLENFTFDNVTSKEQIEAAFNTGIALGEGEVINCATGNVSATRENVTDELSVGDMLAVFRDGRYYLVRIDDITETDNSNADFYEISIKY